MPKLMSKRDVGALLKLHPESVMRLVRKGDFPSPMKLGSGERSQCRWPADVVERWLAEKLKNARAGGAS